MAGEKATFQKGGLK